MNFSSISSRLHTPGSSEPVPAEPAEARQHSFRPLSATGSQQRNMASRSIALQPPAAFIARQQYNAAAMSCLYQAREISDANLLLHMIRDGIKPFHLDIPVTASMKDVRAALEPLLPDYPLSRLWMSLPVEQRDALFDESLSRQLLQTHPQFFDDLPARSRTPGLIDAYVNDNREQSSAIASVISLHPEYPVTLEMKIRAQPHLIGKLPPHERTEELKRLAVGLFPERLSLFKEDPEPGYTALCMAALNKQGDALRYIPEHRITEELVMLALEHDPVAGIADIPAHLRTDAVCIKALERAPALNNASKGDIARYYPEDFLQCWPEFMEHRKRFYHWLAGLPEAERTEELCLEFVQQYPDALHLIPAQILDKHPEWRSPKSIPPSLADHYQYLPVNLLPDNNPQACREQCQAHGRFMHLDRIRLRPGVPPWMCLAAGPDVHTRGLPPHLIDHLMRHGGPDGPAELWGTRLEPVSADALTCAAQESCIPLQAAQVPMQVRERLQFCHPFVFRNQQLGWHLHSFIQQHCQTYAPELAHSPMWSSNLQTAQDWQVHGGRVLCHTGQSPCRRLKFLRAGEKLDNWLPEYAVQEFALQHQRQLELRSEIPRPQAYWRVPVAMLPDPVAKGMTSRLEVLGSEEPGGGWYLAFEFTTKNQDYSHLAWQKDASGDTAPAEEGMKRTFHDLGVWSSLGCLHISTAPLFHNLRDRRTQVILPALLQWQRNSCNGYPGSLSCWDTIATDQSDWGITGLRDIGDVELYGLMEDFLSWSDTDWQLPSFAERGAFMNTLCSNLLAGLLHYMRLHRDAPDWHYQNKEGCLRLQRWIDERFTSFIQGLLGDDTRLEQLFPSPACYAQWLDNTAREILYWSARQNRPGEECFAVHLRENGRPCPSLYPEHPTLYFTYPKDFTDAQGRDHLACKSKKMPLFSLVRGFYLLAYKLADRLEGPERQLDPGNGPV